jgi:hypothetical protein
MWDMFLQGHIVSTGGDALRWVGQWQGWLGSPKKMPPLPKCFWTSFYFNLLLTLPYHLTKIMFTILRSYKVHMGFMRLHHWTWWSLLAQNSFGSPKNWIFHPFLQGSYDSSCMRMSLDFEHYFFLAQQFVKTNFLNFFFFFFFFFSNLFFF